MAEYSLLITASGSWRVETRRRPLVLISSNSHGIGGNGDGSPAVFDTSINLRVAELPAESVTSIVIGNSPASVAVPQITPVSGFRRHNPGGRAPSTIRQR